MAMSQEEIWNGVVNIIAKHAKNQDAVKAINAETSILKDLQVNSARLVDIVLEFEDAFDLEISDDELDTINTVGDAAALVSKLVN